MTTERPYRVAIIGGGDWATRFHAPALRESAGAELVAVCDPDERAARRLAAADEGVRAFADVDEMLAAEDLDAVVVSSPHPTHAPYAITAIEAGLHVLVEKPVATTLAAARDLLGAADRSAVVVAVGYTSQHSAAARAVREWLAGDLGNLVQADIRFQSRMVDHFASGSATYSADNSGGQAHSQLSHAIAGLIWSTGLEATQVVALSNRRGFDVDVDDAVSLVLENGATATAATSGARPAGLEASQRIHFLGDRAEAEWDLLRGVAHLTLATGTRRLVRPHHGEPGYDGRAPVRNLLAAMAGREDVAAPPEPAAAAVAVIEAMYRSIEHRTIEPVERVRP